MLKEESINRQKQLKELLYELAKETKNTDDLRRSAIILRDIYSNNFRHSYAEFFALIVEMSNPDNKYNLEFLSTNLEDLRSIVEDDYIAGGKLFRGLYPNLIRLSDHINLEIARLTYYSENDEKIAMLEKEQKTSQSKLIEAARNLTTAQRKLSNVQAELITVLSIFATIILAFSGSLNLLGNALASVKDAPFYKTVFFVLLCGFVLFNTICILLYMVSKITDKNIMADCEKEKCTCENKKGKLKCNGITRLRKRLPYIFCLILPYLF